MIGESKVKSNRKQRDEKTRIITIKQGYRTFCQPTAAPSLLRPGLTAAQQAQKSVVRQARADYHAEIQALVNRKSFVSQHAKKLLHVYILQQLQNDARIHLETDNKIDLAFKFLTGTEREKCNANNRIDVKEEKQRQAQFAHEHQCMAQAYKKYVQHFPDLVDHPPPRKGQADIQSYYYARNEFRVAASNLVATNFYTVRSTDCESSLLASCMITRAHWDTATTRR